jgi:hypothetical protein
MFRAILWHMTGLLDRLVQEERGHAALGYFLVTTVLSVIVFQPELAAAAVYRLGDLLSLLGSQIQSQLSGAVP